MSLICVKKCRQNPTSRHVVDVVQSCGVVSEAVAGN